MSQLEGDYGPIGGGGAGGAAWGDITGTLGDQTDLDTALGTKLTNQQAIALLSSTQVDTDVGTKQTLYTVPASKKAVITHVVVRSASASLAAMSDVLQLGFTAGADNWGFSIASAALAGLTDATFATGMGIGDGLSSAAIKIGSATDVFGCIFNDAAINATVVIDVFGYLYNA